MTSLKYFLADEQTHWWFSKCCSSSETLKKNCPLNLLTLHVAHCIRAFPRHTAYWIVYSMSLCLSFTATSDLCIVPRGPSSTPYARSLQLFALYVQGHVSRCCNLQRISSESGASTLNTPRILPYVSEYIQQHANCTCTQTHFTHAQTVTKPIHLTYTNPQAFPFTSEEI